MRLYLAVAVLMLAFVAYTEAQDDTVQDRLGDFGQTVLAYGKKVAESAKANYEEVKNSEVVVATGNWFRDRFHAAKKTLNDLLQSRSS